jgi:nucleoside-diphosphate-sugar epimerase
MMNQKMFVTGGTGFVGANLIRLLLQEGYQVKALVRPGSCLDNLKDLDIETVQGNLNDPDLSKKMRDCQGLFHVAAHYSLWQKDRNQLYQSNVLGTRQILLSAKKAGIERCIYTSSVAAIGLDKTGKPVDESFQSPVEDLIGEYKKSKYWAEQEAIKAAKSGQEVVIVNPSTPIAATNACLCGNGFKFNRCARCGQRSSPGLGKGEKWRSLYSGPPKSESQGNFRNAIPNHRITRPEKYCSPLVAPSRCLV